MAENKRYTVHYKRRRKNKTDYKSRLRLLISRKPRLVIRKGSGSIIAQIVEYGKEGDKIVVTAQAKELEKLGWKISLSNMPAAYLLGLLIAKKAKSKKINFCILDTGINPSIKGSRIYAVLKGALDGGLDIPHNINILPDEKRITGQHIKVYVQEIKSSGMHKGQFASYIKNNFDADVIEKEIEKIKQRLIEK